MRNLIAFAVCTSAELTVEIFGCHFVASRYGKCAIAFGFGV